MRARESKLEDQFDFIVVARQEQPHQLLFIDEVHTNKRTGESRFFFCKSSNSACNLIFSGLSNSSSVMHTPALNDF
jgi:hypothetical protein